MNGDLGRACRTGAWVALALGVLGGCNAAPAGNSAAQVHAAAPAAVVEDVRVATARSGLQQDVVTLPSGERMRRVSVSSGFTHVVVAKPGPDGKPSVSCVDSPAAAEAFLTGSTQGTGQ
jgi:hypothetical protein